MISYALYKRQNIDEDEEQAASQNWSFSIISILISFIFVSGFATVLFGKTAGGEIGLLLSQPLVKVFSRFGAAFILFTVFVVSLALSLKISIGALVKSSFIKVFLTLPQIIWGASTASSCAVQSIYIYTFRNYFGVNKIEDDEEEEILPKPRRRRNKVSIKSLEEEEDDDEEDEEYEEEDEDDEEDHEIVVQRREPTPIRGRKKIDTVRSAALSQSYAVEKEDPFVAYKPPSLSLLTKTENVVNNEDDEELIKISKLIESKLRDFAIAGRITEVHQGPVVTLYEFEPAAGVKVGRIAALQNDLCNGT